MITTNIVKEVPWTCRWSTISQCTYANFRVVSLQSCLLLPTVCI